MHPMTLVGANWEDEWETGAYSREGWNSNADSLSLVGFPFAAPRDDSERRSSTELFG